MIATRTSGPNPSIHNLHAAFARAAAVVGTLPDAHDRGQPVKPGPLTNVFQRQAVEVRREIRCEVEGNEPGSVTTCEQAAGGWLLHLWESAGRGRVRVRSVLLPAVLRPVERQPIVSMPSGSREQGRGWVVALGLLLATLGGFTGGVVTAEQYGLRARSPLTLEPSNGVRSVLK
jgi:hypothetical protein